VFVVGLRSIGSAATGRPMSTFFGHSTGLQNGPLDPPYAMRHA
jgi:hypothetical protein